MSEKRTGVRRRNRTSSHSESNAKRETRVRFFFIFVSMEFLFNFLQKGTRNELHSACQRGELDRVRKLLRGGSSKGRNEDNLKTTVPFDITEPDGGEDGDAPLHIAARYGHVSVAKEVCEWGARVNSRNSKGDTPLHLASAHGNCSMIRFLLERKARIESKGNLGRTPLMSAAAAGQLMAVRVLLEHGAKQTGRFN